MVFNKTRGDTVVRFPELSVKGLSRLFYSSLRAVRDAYLRVAKTSWSPTIEYSENGVLEIEGYKLHFYQAEPDVMGGSGVDDSGNKFRVRGGNSLEKITVIPLLDVFGRRIAVLVMEFRDEEHPNPLLDKLYRAFRAAAFLRIRDVEAIALEFLRDSVRIVMKRIYSGSKTYASRVGAHGNHVEETSKTNISIYTSNVWNHAMATWNTNPSLNQLKMKPKIIVKTLKQAITLAPHIIKATSYKKF